MHFRDRIDAAQRLIPPLKKYEGAPETLILAIPRGSLQMGFELSIALNLPLDIVVTKKIPAPGNEEYAIGAVAPDGEVLVNKEVMKGTHIPEAYVEGVKERLLKEIDRRYRAYRGSIEPDVRNENQDKKSFVPEVKGKTIIVIDDGIATGFTLKAAILYLYRMGASKIVVAVPVAAPDAAEEIEAMVDEMIVLSRPEFFSAVAQFYDVFPQVSDGEACKFLQKAHEKRQV